MTAGSATGISRPILRYHGGKWRIAEWIIAHLPEHACYVEPFGGGASVLLRKPRACTEVYNDLDGEVVNLFRVLRDSGQHLLRAVRMTPYAREEYLLAQEPASDPVERARRTLVRAAMGFGTDALRRRCGFRSTLRRVRGRIGQSVAEDWRTYPEALEAIIERLRGVIIEQADALTIIGRYDDPCTLVYADPPYLGAVRDKGEDYRQDMPGADDHARLAQSLRAARGMAVVSGYRCPDYDAWYAGWRRVDRATQAAGGGARIESLWLSQTCSDAQPDLFSGAANAIPLQHR